MEQSLNKTFEKEHKRLILNVFKYLISFLDKKSLKWWAAYGTVIGAVRHKGFIPWDDDIDIWMPREDYQKFLSYKKEFDNEKYTLSHTSTNENHGSRFIKVMYTKSTIQPCDFYPFIMGVFVDIFPLDYSDNSKDSIMKTIESTKKKWTNYFSYYKKYPFSSIVKSMNHPKDFILKCYSNIKSGLLVALFKPLFILL